MKDGAIDKEQIARIKRNEKRLDRIAKAVKRLEDALDAYEKLKPEIAELAAYYKGGMWRKDFEDDEAGLIPKDLKRGVLSEDAVYDLLAEVGELSERLK